MQGPQFIPFLSADGPRLTLVPPTVFHFCSDLKAIHIINCMRWSTLYF